MAWFAVRAVYEMGESARAARVFEERIVAIEADTLDDALQKGQAEAATYAGDNQATAHPELQAYEQDGAALIDGYELFSQLFEAHLSLEAFYEERYRRFHFEPE